MVEYWIRVRDFPFYEISSEGRLRTWRKRGGAWRDQPINMDGHVRGGPYPGYVVYFLQKGTDIKRHKRYAHRLVAEAFLPPPRPDQTEVAHCDGDPSNNQVENLRWATHKENQYDRVQHGTLAIGQNQWNAKFTNGDIVDMRKRFKNGERQCSIRRDFDVAPGYLSQIISRKVWKHLR